MVLIDDVLCLFSVGFMMYFSRVVSQLEHGLYYER